MFKKTILLALLSIITVSLVLVIAAIQALARGEDANGAVPRETTAADGAAAARARPAGPQSVGLEDIQARIRASDEEWKVIGPKLWRVMAASAAAEAGFDESSMGGAGDPGFPLPGRGGPGGPMGGPGKDSFSNPGDGAPFGRGGPGPGGFGRGGPGPGGFGRGGRGPGGFGGMPPFGGPPGFGGPGGNAVMQKLVELRTALADPNTTSEQVREKVGAVRSARQKAKAELAAARKDLLELLTPDQEAILVGLNFLD